MNEHIPPFSSSHYTSIYNSSNASSSSSYIHKYYSSTKLPSSMHSSQQKASKISQIADKQQSHRHDSMTGQISNGKKLSLSAFDNNNEANADTPSSSAGGAGSSSSDVRTSGGGSAAAAGDSYNQKYDNHSVIVKRSHSFQDQNKSISGFQSDHHSSTANNNTSNNGSGGVSTKSIFRRSLRSAFESIRPSFDRQSSIEQQLTGESGDVDDDISSTDNNQLQQRHHHFMHRFPHGNRLIGHRKCKSSSNIFGPEAETKSPELNDRNS